MDTLEKRIVVGLALLAVAMVAVLAARYKQLLPAAGYEDPFQPDRVAVVRIRIPQKDWQWLLANPRAEQYVRADFQYDNQIIHNVAVRPKGNSSLMSVAGSGSPRLSLKIDFNFFNSAQSFRGLKKLCLNNGFSDPSFIREVLGYEIFDQMGLPSPRTAFVDVFVNDLHLGLYTQVEPIDKAFLTRHFANPDGNLYKPQIGAALLNWTEEDVIKRRQNTPQPAQTPQAKNLALNIGGTRLSDLTRLMERERTGLTPNTAPDNAPPFGNPGGGPGDRRPMPLGASDGQPMPPFPGPGEGFPPDRGPDGQNRPLPGEMQGRPPFGPEGGLPDHNRPQGFRANRPGGFGGPGGGFGGPGGRGGDLLQTVALRTNDNAPNHTALFRFLEVLNKCPDDTFPEEIEKVLNVDQVLRYLAVSSMLVHLDNYTGMGHNYYLYEINGYFTILPWDLNMAFGVFRMGAMQGDIADFFIDEPVTGALADRPLVNRLLAHKPYMDRYRHYHEDLLSGPFAEGLLEARIDQWAVLIRPYVEKDDLKFFTMEQFEKGLAEGSGGMDAGMGMRRPGPMNDTPDRRPDMGMPPEMSGPGPMAGSNPMNAPGPMRNNSGRRGGPGGGGPGGMGMGAPGLKSFIAKRRLSVRGQLDGTLPSRPTEEQRQQNTQRQPMMPGGMPR